MTEQSDSLASSIPSTVSPEAEQELTFAAHRLYRLALLTRWWVVGITWLTLVPWSLWSLRSDFALWREQFTWVAVRYALAFNWGATLALFSGVAVLLSVLLWQSRTILFGLSHREQQQFLRQAQRIQQQGTSHPLWKWVHPKR